MGLMDSLIGAATQAVLKGGGNASAGGQSPLLAIAGLLLANDGPAGGLPGLMQRLQKAGLGDALASWIGTGANQPVTAQQLSGALGPDIMGQVAQRLGASPQQAGDQLAQWLPVLIDQLTPRGQAPAGGFGGQAQLLAMVGQLLQKK